MKNLTEKGNEQNLSDSLRNEQEQELKLKGVLCEQLLQRENRLFSDTSGVSEQNRELGFVPAFLDTHTGVSVISRFADGHPAPVHLLDGLPKAWITLLDEEGHACAVREGIIAGFIHAGRFFTRDEAADYGS